MNSEREQRPPSIQFEEVVRLASEVILRDGFHIPTLIVEGNLDAVVVQFQQMASTHEGRAQQMFVAGYTFGHDVPLGALHQVFFITEAWLSLRENRGLPDVPPSSDRNRTEVLTVSSRNAETGQTSMALLQMIRDKSGRLDQLQEVISIVVEQDGEPTTESPLMDAFTLGYSAGKARWS